MAIKNLTLYTSSTYRYKTPGPVNACFVMFPAAPKFETFASPGLAVLNHPIFTVGCPHPASWEIRRGDEGVQTCVVPAALAATVDDLGARPAVGDTTRNRYTGYSSTDVGESHCRGKPELEVELPAGGFLGRNRSWSRRDCREDIVSLTILAIRPSGIVEW